MARLINKFELNYLIYIDHCGRIYWVLLYLCGQYSFVIILKKPRRCRKGLLLMYPQKVTFVFVIFFRDLLCCNTLK